MLVLGIETSCDETALALVEEGRRVLGTQVASSLEAHQRYGGVVPEIASRAHLELITYELEHLLGGCRITPDAVDRIAVTYGPGLAGSLLVGIAAAKALGLCWRKPVVGINHLQAHLYAALMEAPSHSLNSPMIGLVISGGHTALVRMNGIDRLWLLGQTRDDAVGEAFDKVARLLGLGFPGGPEIERVGVQGDPRAFRFSVPKIKGGSLFDFSLSGIKTAVYYKVKERNPLSPSFVADMAASFQRAIVEEVVMKSVSACRRYQIPRLIVGGGVIANRVLRERLREVCADLKIDLAIPPVSLCTVNGAMVAGLGRFRGVTDLSELTAVPGLRVELN
jgi:N6-L-threonylcarbamoyladenine synthase